MKPPLAPTWLEQLAHDWCDEFAVTELRQGGFVVETPFISADGDGMTLVVRHTRDGWELSDRGSAVSHLQLARYQLTESRSDQLDRLASAFGVEFRDGELTTVLSEPPSTNAIAEFIQLSCQVRALPLINFRQEPAEEQFRTRARQHFRTRIALADECVDNWAPSTDPQKLFVADLWVPSNSTGVAAFFAAADEKVERSLNSALQYREWGIDVHPLIVHQRGPSSRAIARAQTALGGADVIEVDERSSTFAYREAERRLRDLGVELQPAA